MHVVVVKACNDKRSSSTVEPVVGGIFVFKGSVWVMFKLKLFKCCFDALKVLYRF